MFKRDKFKNLNTNNAKNMSWLFFNCNSLLRLINLSFQTNNATEMNYMIPE